MKNNTSEFTINGYSLEELTEGTITFHYSLRHGLDEYDFFEDVLFDPKKVNLPAISQGLLKNVCDNLSMFLALSYWKLYAPKKINILNNFLTQQQAEFWNSVYTKGMGEFYFKNKIDFRGLVSIPFDESALANRVREPRADRSLLLIGGGKDSLASAELLMAGGKKFTGFMMNIAKPQVDTIKTIGCESIAVIKKISPNLLELNKRDDVYNGHVPISLGYTLCALLACVLFDYRYIIASNEITASYGNTEYLSMDINHQWTKSLEFERMIQQYIHEFITPDVTYFSLLRPFHEIGIVQYFAKHPKYFMAFSSCNRNFRMTQEKPRTGWCNECAKDPFAFLLLACFLTKEQVMEIFGENLLDKPSAENTYRELLGLENIKPFECVGTPEETAVAFYLIYKKGEYKNDHNMKMFVDEVLPRIEEKIEDMKKNVFSRGSEHMIPDEFVGLLDQMSQNSHETL